MKTSHHAPLSFFITLILLTAASFVAAPAAQAGPWTKSTGEFYAKIGEGFYSADAFRTADGELISGTNYFSATTYLYAEYGVLAVQMWRGGMGDEKLTAVRARSGVCHR